MIMHYVFALPLPEKSSSAVGVNFLHTVSNTHTAACVLSEILMNPADMQRERGEMDARVKCWPRWHFILV